MLAENASGNGRRERAVASPCLPVAYPLTSRDEANRILGKISRELKELDGSGRGI